KKIFEEQTLRFEVDEKQTELILCRWKTTNVTVGEVRSALEKLSSLGKNPSDINLIHETIAVTRRENLRALAS
ncbi:hypothetical protein, partial [Candidatus Pantoea gossypiicola]